MGSMSSSMHLLGELISLGGELQIIKPDTKTIAFAARIPHPIKPDTVIQKIVYQSRTQMRQFKGQTAWIINKNIFDVCEAVLDARSNEWSSDAREET